MKNTILQLLVIPILAVVLMSSNCKEETQNTSVKVGQAANIEVKVITRGSYQYLINIGSEKYLSENLPKEFQQDKLEVILDYKILNKKVSVYKPGATDIPKEDYQVNLIDIINIKKK